MSMTIRAPRTNTLQPAADMRRWADRNPSAQNNAAKPVEPIGQAESQTVGTGSELALVQRPLRSDRFNLTQSTQPPAGFVAQVIGQNLTAEVARPVDAAAHYRRANAVFTLSNMKSELGHQ